MESQVCQHTSHSGFLLLSCTAALVLRAGFVELPGDIEQEGATGWVVGGQFAVAIDDGFLFNEFTYPANSKSGRTKNLLPQSSAGMALFAENGVWQHIFGAFGL